MCDLDQKRVNAKNLSFWTVVLEKILESPLYNKEIKPINLKGNQPLTCPVSAEASTEGLQVERMDASTAKVPNLGSFKQWAFIPTSGGSSEWLKALCNLGPLIHALHSPQQHWRPRKGHSGPWRGGVAEGPTGAITYQVGLERKEQAYVAESWWLWCGNKRAPALHELPHPNSPGGEAQW